MIAGIVRIVTALFSIKAFVGVGLPLILGIIGYNVVVELIQEVMTFALSEMGAVSTSGIANPTISGFAAWLAIQFRIPECVAVMVNMATLAFVMRKIPFLKW